MLWTAKQISRIEFIIGWYGPIERAFIRVCCTTTQSHSIYMYIHYRARRTAHCVRVRKIYCVHSIQQNAWLLVGNCSLLEMHSSYGAEFTAVGAAAPSPSVTLHIEPPMARHSAFGWMCAEGKPHEWKRSSTTSLFLYVSLLSTEEALNQVYDVVTSSCLFAEHLFFVIG